MKNIESLDNKLIKEVVDLKESKNRKKKGLFLVDGLREINLAMLANYELVFLFFLERNTEEERDVVSKALKTKAELIIINEKVLKKIAYKENSDGFLAVFKIKSFSLENLINTETNYPIIVLEGIEKPGNLGAIIRTASAAGLKNIVLNDCLIDIYNPNVIKASEGLLFFVNIFNDSKEKTLSLLKTNKIKTIGAITSAKKSYDQINFLEKTAIILGSEAQGLSEFWLKKIDEKIRIPMRKEVDSLNVSVSAAILIYEAIKQNSFFALK